MAREYEKGGENFTIKPFTPARLTETLRGVKGKLPEDFDPSDPEQLKKLEVIGVLHEFIAEQARVCVENWTKDGKPFLSSSPERARAQIMDRPKVAAWIVARAKEIAEEEDKEFEEQSGN